MSDSTRKPTAAELRELRPLIAGLCDDTLLPEQAKRLEELICASPGCCEYYVKCMQVEAMLPRFAGETVPIANSLLDELASNRASSTCESIGSCDLPVLTAERAACDAPVSLAQVSLPEKQRGSRAFHLQIGAFGLGLAALILIALGLFAYRPSIQEPAVATSRPALPTVKSVRLETGCVRVEIDKVGWVIVDGPSDFQLIGPKRARLNQGRIKMRVTQKSGRGFVIETPDGDVTDLGTEFGIEVSDKGKTELVVFEGAVDLRVANDQKEDERPLERLVQGEGAVFNRGGQPSRINKIFTGAASTFLCRNEGHKDGVVPVIVDVSDNLRGTDTKNYYEIVTGGMREDARAYVDRPEHEWNGITKQGLPSYLIGADYVKPFNSDKTKKGIEISVELGCPAILYVWVDDRLKETPAWLQKDFERTVDKVGLDGGRWSGSKIRSRRGKGPGKSIDEKFTIWKRIVPEPCVVKLGENSSSIKASSGMYGIAAVALDSLRPLEDSAANSPTP